LSQEQVLALIASEVIVCPKCRLSKTRKNAVPGEGNSNGQIMLIGEGPGYWEDVKGRPFVGDAGKFLDTLLAEIGFSRTSVFITNIVKCRPPRNREPLPDEIQACTPYLDRQMQTIQPKFIVTLGSHSTAYVFSKAGLPFSSITQAHGRLHETTIQDMRMTVFPTFHPAAALYNAKYKELLTKDFQVLRNELVKRGIVNRQSC
jgi:DNA polymerase